MLPAIASLLLPALALDAQGATKKRPRAVPAAPAVPATPASSAAEQKASPQLISSEIGGRDMVFVAHAMDLGRALKYLATQTPRTSNPALRGYGDDIVKTLAAQTAVLNTVAEMRQVKLPDEASTTEKRVASKLDALEGIKLEKALLDAFIEIDRKLIAAYEIGAKSDDVIIRKFVDQTLPVAREHLVLVEAMAGISSKGAGGTAARAASGSAPTAEAPTPKPAFRTKVPSRVEPRLEGDR
jgi:putative membrane protein